MSTYVVHKAPILHLWLKGLCLHPWMEKPNGDGFPSGEYLDILAISCDSFDEQVNVLIGRGQGNKNHVENLHKLRTWCKDYRVAFKINSVINRFNVDEDMTEHIKALNPIRWKVRTELLLLVVIKRTVRRHLLRQNPK